MLNRFGLLSCGLALLFVLQAGTGCAGVSNEPVKGNGIAGERWIECGEFSRVQLNGTVDVKLQQCPNTSVVIKGDDNLLDLIDCVLQNGTLMIDNDEQLQPKLGLLIEICTPVLNAVTLSGAADLTALDLACGQLELILNGVGDINLSGKIDNLQVGLSGVGDLNLTGKAGTMDAALSGVGDLNAADLVTESVTVNLSGVGDAVVHPLSSLDASVSGVGDIIFHGNPTKLSKQVSGAGEIIHRNKPDTER